MKRLTELLKFSAPKGTGLRIRSDCYLTVLIGTPTLPPVNQMVSPDGPVPGFAVPLAQGATKNDLSAPMERGSYAVSSLDKKTILDLKVLPVAEVGFQADVVARQLRDQSDELRHRIAATWWLGQLTFSSHSPNVEEALDFQFRVALQLANLTGGVIGDPMAQRYSTPDMHDPTPGLIENIVNVEKLSGGVLSAGLVKVNHPELRLTQVNPADLALAEVFLLSAAATILHRGPLKPGDQLGAAEDPLIVCEDPTANGANYELLPAGHQSLSSALHAWNATK